MPILRERRVLRNLLIKSEASKPAPRQMHAQFFDSLALARDAVEIANQQDAQQKFGIDGWPPRSAVTPFQLFAYEIKADVLFNEPQQMCLWNLIFQAEVIEQRFGTGVLSHHD